MKEDRQECLKDLNLDGMELILYLVEISVNNNKDIEITMRLILNRTEKTKGLKSF